MYHSDHSEPNEWRSKNIGLAIFLIGVLAFLVAIAVAVAAVEI